MASINKAVIAGGGVGGLVTALALHEAGVEVEIHEKHPRLQGLATGFSIWAFAVVELLKAGLTVDDLGQIGRPIEAFEMYSNAKHTLTLPVGPPSRALGADTYDMERRRLQEVIIDKLPEGTLHLGSEVVGLELADTSASLVLADGTRATGEVVIAADGTHSVLREQINGMPGSRNFAGWQAWSAVAASDVDMPTVRLSTPKMGGLAGGVGRGRYRWVIMAPGEAGRADPFPADEARALVEPCCAEAAALIASTPPEDIVRSESWDLEPLQTWVRGRAVMIGDAAHAEVASASLGASSTIVDAVALVRHLTGDAPIDDALAAYQQERKAVDERVVVESRKAMKETEIHGLHRWARDIFYSHARPQDLEKVAADMVAGRH